MLLMNILNKISRANNTIILSLGTLSYYKFTHSKFTHSLINFIIALIRRKNTKKQCTHCIFLFKRKKKKNVCHL